MRQRSDAAENREAILAAAKRLLEHSPRATVTDIAAAAGVSRATVYRHFKSREVLAAAVAGQVPPARAAVAEPLPAGRLGRRRPVPLEAINVFDAVPPPALPEQLLAEAQVMARISHANVIAIYDVGTYRELISPTGDADHVADLCQPPRSDEAASRRALGPQLDALVARTDLTLASFLDGLQ